VVGTGSRLASSMAVAAVFAFDYIAVLDIKVTDAFVF
jgi:hypothetical protein